MVADQSSQVGAGYVFGDEEVGVAVLVGKGQADEIRMVELGLGADFTAKTRHGGGIPLTPRQNP